MFRVSALIMFTIMTGVVLFQNCGSNGFQSAVILESMNHDQPHIMRTSSFERPNVDMIFSLHGLADASSYSWSHEIGGVNLGCSLKSNNTMSSYTIFCSQSGALTVRLTALKQGREIKMEYKTNLSSAPLSDDIPMEIVFEIPSGTRSSPWNRTETIVETFVGQTLKIINMDSVDHQLHTSGRPCGHGSKIVPGASSDCVINATYSRAANGVIYDHLVGPSAEFYLVAYSGEELYATNCQSCHLSIASSERRGATVSQIDRAIQDIPAMRSQSLMRLTPRQKQAIAKALAR